MTKKPEKVSLRGLRRSKSEEVKPREEGGSGKKIEKHTSILIPKVKTVRPIVSLALTTEVKQGLHAIQEQLSVFVEPVNLSMVFDFIYARAMENPAFKDRIKKQCAILNEIVSTHNRAGKTSVSLDPFRHDWILKTVGLNYKGFTVFCHWIVDDWPWIVKTAGFKNPYR